MGKFQAAIKIEETTKLVIESTLRRMLVDDTLKEYEFPSSLSSEERRFVHNYATKLNIKTKSRGYSDNRYVTAYRPSDSTLVQRDSVLSLNRSSERYISSLIHKNPLSEKETRELQPLERPSNAMTQANEGKDSLNCTTGRLNNVIPQVPPQRQYGGQTTSVYHKTLELPIAKYKEEILQKINDNSVVLISGETGCGKTTQVPQYILDQSSNSNRSCRIIAAEPRRLAALSVADRVAYERGEQIGQTVGYQIRLESKVSPRTLLTFCTNGVLLRTLMGGDGALSTITHIIVDEVHERDRFSDLLLTVLREFLSKQRNLKLILMSACCDIERFQKYFDNCPTVFIPGVCHEVQYTFLENILRTIGYRSEEYEAYKKRKQRDNAVLVNLEQELPAAIGTNADIAAIKAPLYASKMKYVHTVNNNSYEDISPDLRSSVDEVLHKAFVTGTDDDFQALAQLCLDEDISGNYTHSLTGVTPLIASVFHGKDSYVMAFTYNLGGDPHRKCRIESQYWSAVDWAKYLKHPDVLGILDQFIEEEPESLSSSEPACDDDQMLLNFYTSTVFNDEDIDQNLLLMLVKHIVANATEEPKGAILVFLPGYDEIVCLRERIIEHFEKNFQTNKYVLYTLHSQMQSSDQKRVFKSVPPDVRKIILSTNLAETSVTIDDVVYVIDCGKMKEKTFDSLYGVSSLMATWISEANAIQRRGRAGRTRPGVCYHLYSSARYKSFPKFQVPELLRMPIHELCLQVKLLAPNLPIAKFLEKAPEPPSASSVKHSIALLMAIDALNEWEQLTELGVHLLDLPVEPHLGKMILYSVVLKCLDPILTIVCTLAYRDPFLMPANTGLKKAALAAKHKLSFGTLSDHMVLLRAFHNWQKSRTDGCERNFCENNFISGSTMEMIVGMRAQLLGQLRASGFVRARGPGDIRDLNTNSENWSVVKAVLCAGSYPKLMRLDKDRGHLVTCKDSKVRFHPSSVLNPKGVKGTVTASQRVSFPSDWFLYEEMTKIGRFSYGRCCTLVSPVTVALFSGPARLPPDSITVHYTGRDDEDLDDESSDEHEQQVESDATFKIDDWLSFKTLADDANLVYSLRQKFQALFLRRMSSPGKSLTLADDAVIKTIVDVMTTEEQVLGLQQPVGVGQRPRPMASEYCPPVSNTLLNSPQQRSLNHNSQPMMQQRQQPQQGYHGGGGGGHGSGNGGRSPRSQAFSGKTRLSKRY
ncbi:3'-5' RNA helicase YTHDC2 [Halotydeus destructor]|nr:3'-5' RNA helicase YTHDC2 [Halotydeus destructor]